VLWYLPIAAKQCDCIEFFAEYFEKTSKLLIFPTECDFTNHTKNSRNQASSGDHEPCTVRTAGQAHLAQACHTKLVQRWTFKTFSTTREKLAKEEADIGGQHEKRRREGLGDHPY
jgi:hypothetical protein